MSHEVNEILSEWIYEKALEDFYVLEKRDPSEEELEEYAEMWRDRIFT